MLWCSLIELDFLISIIVLIIYGLFSLRSVNLNLSDVYFFCRILPLLFVAGYFFESTVTTDPSYTMITPSIDILVAILTFVVMGSFKSFESVLLLLFAFIGNYFMLHSIDLLTFFIALEAQNFCFFVLCGLLTNNSSSNSNRPLQNRSFSVEASIKFFVLSAFTSGVLLFWFSAIYLQTGLSVLTLSGNFISETHSTLNYQILCALLFKLGAAPLHLWIVQIYGSVKRNLLMYISTLPKLSLFGFWTSTFQSFWTFSSVVLFALFSLFLGSFSAYSQPALRNLFAYSTINEMGIMLLAIETAGFHSLFQHLGIYIIAQLLLWNLYEKNLFTVAAVSLAGLPPLAGFFGKAWIFWHASSVGLITVLAGALFCTGVSLVYYLRIIRLFWNSSTATSLRVLTYDNPRFITYSKASGTTHAVYNMDARVMLTSTCVVLLVFLPFFVIKPFVL